MKSLLAMVGLTLALAATPALADAHKKKEAMKGSMGDVTYISKQQPGTWLVGNFMGLDVKNTAGETIGDINNLVVGKGDIVTAAVIGVGGFLGIGEKNVAIPFSALTINPAKNGERVVVVNVTRKHLENAPAYDQTEPSFSEKAQTMINKANKSMHSASENIQKSAEEMKKSAEEMMKSDEAKKKNN